MNSKVTQIDFSIDVTLAQFNAAQWLDRYWTALSEENAKVNLVSRETTRDDFRRMIAEALLPFTQYQPSNSGYLDIGSGGGIPSVPILASGLITGNAVLFERTQKKARALERICRALGISGVEVVAESFGERPIDRQFSLVTLSWVQLTPPLFSPIRQVLGPGSAFVYYSKPDFDLSGAAVSTFSYARPGADIPKFFSIITK